MKHIEIPKLFVWRLQYEDEDTLLYPDFDKCIYCGFNLKDDVKSERDEENCVMTKSKHTCLSCGWYYNTFHGQSAFGSRGMLSLYYSGLAKFSIDDPGLAIHELGSHVKRKFSDIYSITPSRFEELIADVFKQYGYHTQLTTKTRDGGVDIFLFQRDKNDFAVVECKRYAAKRKVGVYTVDRLLGAAMVKGSKKAILVTTSSFTNDARIHSTSHNLPKYGLEVDLIDAGSLLKMLGVYNTDLPPLHIEWEKRCIDFEKMFDKTNT